MKQETSQCTWWEMLKFDNQVLQQLPLDTSKEPGVRQVRNACYSLVDPTPVDNPRLVAHSQTALDLLGITPNMVDDKEFAQYFSGSSIMPGSEPAAHCYCGHQFGHFAGQLGDGAAIYLGEVLKEDGERWEVQLKGAGLTPYSRQGDGRKVLRSSLREFLASEAMHHLGIPTTRAGSVVVSDTQVVRDQFYNGNVQQENCTVVSRIANTFLRFGSFEICKPTDEETGRRGPSAGLEQELLPRMLNYVIRNFYPHIWSAHQDQNGAHECAVESENGGAERAASSHAAMQPMWTEFLVEIAKRTAQLAAKWQGVGFCHGVLNTDNLSITGLTIDYGPYGFLDRYDPDHICNTSDQEGRYTYARQPEMCRWNCNKLVEALSPVLVAPEEVSALVLAAYDEEFDRHYSEVMRAKLGLLGDVQDGDKTLISDLLDVMNRTGADFTLTFRRLADFKIANDGSAEVTKDNPALLSILEAVASPLELGQAMAPSMPLPTLKRLEQFSKEQPGMLALLGYSEAKLAQDLKKYEDAKVMVQMDPSAKRDSDVQLWTAWLTRYGKRLTGETSDQYEKRRKVMNGANPRFILRNWVAQQAIEKAEAGDFTEARNVLQLLANCFSEEPITSILGMKDSSSLPNYEARPPEKYVGLCVSCSS